MTGKVVRGTSPPAEKPAPTGEEAKAKAQTPSEKILAEASEEFTVTDSRGRKLHCTRLGLLDQMRLIEVVGGDTAQNGVYMMMAGMVCSVRSINGEPESPVRTKLELEAKFQRVGDEGVAAIREHFEALGEQLGGEAELDQIRK